MSPIAAPVIAPRPTALPRSRSGREHRFQGAIAACGDAGRYRDVPVDWFDTAAAVWRPTAVLRAGPALAGLRRQAEVLIPDASGTDIREVDIACLRLPRLLTAGVGRFWTARYRRLLLLTLIERSDEAPIEAAKLQDAHEVLRGAELLARDVWATAFRTGVTITDDRALGEGPAALSDRVEAAAAVGLGATGAAGGALAAARPMLSADLLRVHGALRDAGATDAEIAGHPLLNTVASLLLAASEAAPVPG